MKNLFRAGALVVGAMAGFGSGACDPVQSDAIAALGGEVSGIRPGPTHRAGQPCLLCHDGSGDPPPFTVAGTIFETPLDRTGVGGVRVTLTDARDSTYTATTNVVGNFYVSERQWAPTYPMRVVIMSGDTRVEMKTHVGRDGSCAGCHTDPTSAQSPGHVYVSDPNDAGAR